MFIEQQISILEWFL